MQKRHAVARRWRGAWLMLGLLTLAGCNGLTENDVLPPDVQDPDDTFTPEGALAAYNGVRYVFQSAFDDVVFETGMLTDELGTNLYGKPVLQQPVDLDRRHLPDGEVRWGVYGRLQTVRRQAGETVGLLASYAPDLSPALRGHAYTLAGYAEVFLADQYCSGIPLSTVDYQGDYTLKPGSDTDDVYAHALALFDTALVLAADSARVLDLARVGRGRALLALGRYAEAGAAVSAVADGFAFTVTYGTSEPNILWDQFDAGSVTGDQVGATMTDREGVNGLPWRSGDDPRVAVDSLGQTKYGYSIFFPAKYDRQGTGPMVVADGIEARLIEAEAALHAGGDWLGILNALRTSGAFTTQPSDTNPAVIDTLWQAGTGGVAGLAPLEDPGSFDAQVDLLFQERGYWLYLTGHRQGDLRRLVRVYGRDAPTVYPTGLFPDGQGIYGTDVAAPLPPLEAELNPLYSGCIHRGA